MIVSVTSVSANGIPEFGIIYRDVSDSEIVPPPPAKNKYVVVNLKEKVHFSAYTVNVDKINWNFGDKTKIAMKKTVNQTSIVSHTFKKVGTYNVTVDMEGRVDKINFVDTKHFVTVKVVKKPDLTITSINHDRKGKDITTFQITVKNKGTVASKASSVKMWYENPKFKKLTRTVKIPALKAGKSATVLIEFNMPYKNRKQIKYITVDPNNKIAESIKSNNKKRLNDMIKQ